MMLTCCAQPDSKDSEVIVAKEIKPVVEEEKKQKEEPAPQPAPVEAAPAEEKKPAPTAPKPEAPAAPTPETTPSPVEQKPVEEAKPAPSSEKVVSLKKTGAKLGLDLDPSDGQNLWVQNIKDDSVCKSTDLKVGDVIMSVNDVGGDSSKMISKIQEASDLKFVARCTKEFSVSVTGTLGLDLKDPPSGKPGTYMLVTGVNDGAIKQWNAANPDKEIKACSRVLVANGEKGNPAAIKKAFSEGKAANKWELVFASIQ